MNEKLKKLTGKNPADFEPAAEDIVNNSDTELFSELVEQDSFLFDFVKQNVAKRLEKACNQSNYLNLLNFLKFYSPSYEDFIVSTLAKYSDKNLTEKMLEIFKNGTTDEKIYCAKYFSLIKTPKATDLLKEYAYSQNSYLSSNCASALASIGDRSLFNKSVKLLSSDDDFIKLDAVRFLVSFQDTSAVEDIIKAMMKSSMADNIAGELLYLTDLFHIYKKNQTYGLYVFNAIIEGLGEILNLSQVFDFQLYEFIEMLIKEPLNSQIATVLLAAQDKFHTLTENDEYLFDETKDTKQEILEIKNLLNSVDPANLFKLTDNELRQDSLFVFSALEYTENDKLVRNLLKSSNPTLVVKALEVLKMLEVMTPQDKETALNSISDENLRAVINAL